MGGFAATKENGMMGNMRMRVFYGPSTDAPAPPAEERVTVPLGDICELLADAYHSGRAWISDFADDEVTISSDLYDVLMAYRFYRKRRS